MFDGLIRETGTPKELRDGLGLRRLELRTDDLGAAEEILSRSDAVHDVQRFGDRLDLMVKDAEVGRREAGEILEREGIRCNLTSGVRHR